MFNYDKSFSLGCIASAGTFAIMIPPSIAFVVYGIVTGESIGKLLVAGIFPGILTVIIYLIGIWVICRFNPKLAPLAPIKFTGREKLRSTLGLWGIGVLFILVMGGIYVGLFTPSAGAAVGTRVSARTSKWIPLGTCSRRKMTRRPRARTCGYGWHYCRGGRGCCSAA